VETATETLTGTKVRTDTYAFLGEAPIATKSVVPVSGGTEIRRRVVGVNPHGDLAYLAGMDGTLKGSTTYTPWGEKRSQSGEGAELGFQGDWTDADTGMVDMGARLYAPDLGRFTTTDPVAGDPSNPASMNEYIYGWDDPVSTIDPDGMRVEKMGHEGSKKITWKPRASKDIEALPISDEPGLTTCTRERNATAADYLAGACPPRGFPYKPEIALTVAGPRAVDPFGDKCSVVTDAPLGVDFSRPCLTHDYGYDLIRFGATSQKDYIDNFLEIDPIQTECTAYIFSRPDFTSCALAAATYRAAVAKWPFGPKVGDPIATK
jgi:RHS repeat-associated protein